MIEHRKECVLLKGWFSTIPLHNACRRGHLEVVKVLMESVQVSNSDCYEQLIAVTEGQLQTPLHLAAMQGYTKIVEYLLEKCLELRIELAGLRNSVDGETPVHVAAYKGRVE